MNSLPPNPWRDERTGNSRRPAENSAPLAWATFAAAGLALFASVSVPFIVAGQTTAEAVRAKRVEVYADYSDHLHELDSLLRNNQQWLDEPASQRQPAVNNFFLRASGLLALLDKDEAKIEMIGSSASLDLLRGLRGQRQAIYNRFTCGSGVMDSTYCAEREQPLPRVSSQEVIDALKVDRELLAKELERFLSQARQDLRS